VWLAFITQIQGGKIVKQRMTGVVVGAILVALSMMSFGAPARADDRAEIRALEERFVAAMKAKDLDAIMKVYAPGRTLFVFDVIPPRQYVGAAAYRKDWQTFLDSFEGRLIIHEHVSVPVDLDSDKPDLNSKP
jgi:hypothetical protein